MNDKDKGTVMSLLFCVAEAVIVVVIVLAVCKCAGVHI